MAKEKPLVVFVDERRDFPVRGDGDDDLEFGCSEQELVVVASENDKPLNSDISDIKVGLDDPD